LNVPLLGQALLQLNVALEENLNAMIACTNLMNMLIVLVVFPVASVANAVQGNLRPGGHSHGGMRHIGSKGSIPRTKQERHMRTRPTAQVNDDEIAAAPVIQQAVHTPAMEAAWETAPSARSVASQVPATLPVPSQQMPSASMTSMINPSGSDPDAQQALPTSSSSSSSEAASQLQRELSEAKQRRANIVQLEKVLTANTALLRESNSLESVASSARARADAEEQVRKSKQFVEEVSAMLKQSRADAAREARQALSDASKVRAAAEELSAEAADELRFVASSTGAQTTEIAAATKSQVPAQAEAAAAAAATAAPVAAAEPTATMMSAASALPPLSQGAQTSDIDDLEDDP